MERRSFFSDVVAPMFGRDRRMLIPPRTGVKRGRCPKPRVAAATKKGRREPALF
jgi:hypothetical protein